MKIIIYLYVVESVKTTISTNYTTK